MRIVPKLIKITSLPLALAATTTINVSNAYAAPIKFAFVGPCSGETVNHTSNNSHVLTTGHCFTKALQLFGLSLSEQTTFLKELGAIWLTKKPDVFGPEDRQYFDGAILVPINKFFPQRPPINPPGQKVQTGTKIGSWHKVNNDWIPLLFVEYLTNNKKPSNINYSFTFNSLNGLSMTSGKTGFRANLSDPKKYTQGDPFIPGDSGGNGMYNGESVGAFFASDDINMFFYPVNGSPQKKFNIPR